MVVAWIILVWLLSLAVFVALRAYGTRNRRRAAGLDRTVEMPAQREPSNLPARATDRG